MDNPNPYDSPQSQETSKAAPDDRRGRPVSRPFLFVGFAVAGAIMGSILLAPFARRPGDPAGNFVGAIVGAAIGVIACVVVRLIRTR
jgi:hypothetical protein